MNKKIAAFAFLPVLGIGLFAADAASAHGGRFFSVSGKDAVAEHEHMFAAHAALLGISIDEAKDAWADGKHISQIAKEKGISESDLKIKMKQAHQQKMEAHIQALVDKGVITKAQGEKRLEMMKKHIEKGGGHKEKHHRGKSRP